MTDLRSRLQAALGDVYVVEREFGAGSMSRVFLATESSLRRQVVIKLLPPELASEVSIARFNREMELAAHLLHPHILPVLTAGAKDDLLFYVTPFVSGETLRSRLTRDGKLAVPQALRLIYEIADALAHAHAAGVIHRDIKPENILLAGDHALLADFGVARALAEAGSGGRLTATGISVGTPGYMSPEQMTGEGHVDARTDVYALAVVSYEMLAGAPPFAGPTPAAVFAARLTQAPRALHELRPDVPRHVSAAIMHALEPDPTKRLHSAVAFRDAISVPNAPPAPQRWRARLSVATAVAFAVLAIVAFVLQRGQAGKGVDVNRVAVAPFDVLDPKLALWREGFVDVLSRNLDGAGPLRTVSPTIVVRRWTGRADPTSGTRLGQGTGAGLVIVGSLLSSFGDSVRVTASLLDVKGKRSIGDVELRGESARMDELADTLTIALLRELGRTRPIGAVRLASIGSKSLPSLRAFLQGEQFYRRSMWDSAILAYERAVSLDSTFALALSHMGRALTWKRSSFADSLALSYSLRAGAFNKGLTARESLVVAADSLAATLYAFAPDTSWWSRAHRAHAMLDEAARRFPEDPDVWYNLGELRYHLPLPGLSRVTQLEPFERAIALDSAFGPAYNHAVGLRLWLGDSARARGLLRAYSGLNARDQFADQMRLVAKLLDPSTLGSTEVQRTLDTASADLLGLDNFFRHWPDSAETSIRLNRLLAAGRRTNVPRLRDPSVVQRDLVVALAFRGHLSEAYQIARNGVLGLQGIAQDLPIWSLLGVVPESTAASLFHSWLPDDERAPLALPWWSARADTVPIRELLAALSQRVRRATGLDGGKAAYWIGAANAYLAIARRDTVRAVQLFGALHDSMCVRCSTAPQHLMLAQLLTAQSRYREAGELLASDYHWSIEGVEVLWRLQRARVAEQLGNREVATSEYSFVADVWRRADPILQPYVREAKDGLHRLNVARR